MQIKAIYEDNNVLVIDKPAGINSDDFEKRVHRLDKDTSGILLIAKNNESLEFLQRQFKERKVRKKYLALVVGNLKNKKGDIETLIGRSPSNGLKQKVYFPHEPGSQSKRTAITKYKVLRRFTLSNSRKANLTGFKNYDLIEVEPETGRKHQIRCHLAHINHPIAGDKIYGFKNQPCPKGLNRHFLHASYLRFKLPNGAIKEIKSKLPEELEKTLENLKIKM